MKTWLKPTLTTINMNAEIGGYQADEERPEEPTPRDADVAAQKLELAATTGKPAASRPEPVARS